MGSFYTKKGDDGLSGLLGAGRYPKSELIYEVIGTLDEASAVIGLARAQSLVEETKGNLLRIQRELYGIMAEVSATPENVEKFRTIGEPSVQWLEEIADSITHQVQMPKEFIVPGDTFSGALMAQARTVVRRAERRVAELFHNQQLENKEILRYLNRLSSLLFVLELKENDAAGIPRTTRAKKG